MFDHFSKLLSMVSAEFSKTAAALRADKVEHSATAEEQPLRFDMVYPADGRFQKAGDERNGIADNDDDAAMRSPGAEIESPEYETGRIVTGPDVERYSTANNERFLRIAGRI